MNSRKVILLALALLIGLGTFMMFRASQTPPPAAPAVAVVETTEILAAARDLPTGTILRDGDMKWLPWAATADTGKLYVKGKADSATLVGAVLREGLRTDEPILVGRVVQPHEQGFLAAVLTPGMRAVSLSLSPSAEVAGFIFPGDHVDVILTHGFSRKDISSLSERHVSETVAVDVRVLALDQKSDNQTTDPKVAQLATLEVTPRQAEKLALAGDMIGTLNSGHGSLTLALRSLATDEKAEAVNALAVTLPATALAPLPIKDASATPGPTWDSDISAAYPAVNGEDGLTQRVHIMRGKDVTDTTFDRHR